MAYVRRHVLLPPAFEIQTGHVAHRDTVFSTPLLVGNSTFWSISQIFHSCCLAQHSLFEEVRSLWNRYPECVKRPLLIHSVVEGYLQSRNIEHLCSWTLNIKEMMQICLFTILSDTSSDLYRFFDNTVKAGHGTNVRFVEVTCSRKERLWSCGHPPNRLPRHPSEYSGANLFGELLTDLYLCFYRNIGTEVYESLTSIERTLKQLVLPRANYHKTAVILSDSTFRHVKHIEGGSIWIQTGYTFGNLAEAITRKFGNLANFKYIIIAAGTNDASRLKHKRDYDISWMKMVEVLKPLRDHPHTMVLINTGLGLPSTRSVRTYTKWFSDAFRDDFGQCSNFRLFDWSTQNSHNFFMKSDGSADMRYLDHGTYDHPNVSGTRRMWQEMGKTLANDGKGDLRVINFVTTNLKYDFQTLEELDTLI